MSQEYFNNHQKLQMKNISFRGKPALIYRSSNTDTVTPTLTRTHSIMEVQKFMEYANKYSKKMLHGFQDILYQHKCIFYFHFSVYFLKSLHLYATYMLHQAMPSYHVSYSAFFAFGFVECSELGRPLHKHPTWNTNYQLTNLVPGGSVIAIVLSAQGLVSQRLCERSRGLIEKSSCYSQGSQTHC